MKKCPLLFLLLLATCVSFSQVSKVKYKERQIRKFVKKVQTDMLYVVIENEKTPEDAALVAAVKKYWKQGSYKFISTLDFSNTLLKQSYRSDELYLYKSATVRMVKYGVLAPGVNYYLENNPGLLNYQFRFSYNLPNGGYDLKGKVLDGYYDLMIKHLDNELSLMKNETKRKAIKRRKKRGVRFFVNDIKELKEKDILYVKELANLTAVKNIKEKTKNNERIKKELVKYFKVQRKRIYTVFPEDISMAVAKGDKNVLVFDGSDLIDPSDGTVKATYQGREFNIYNLAYGTIITMATLFVAGILYGVFIFQ